MVGRQDTYGPAAFCLPPPVLQHAGDPDRRSRVHLHPRPHRPMVPDQKKRVLGPQTSLHLVLPRAKRQAAARSGSGSQTTPLSSP